MEDLDVMSSKPKKTVRGRKQVYYDHTISAQRHASTGNIVLQYWRPVQAII